MKKLAVIVAAISILAMAALAYGDMSDHGMGSGMMCGCGMDGQRMEAQHNMSKHLMKLNLDEQQKVLIGEIKSRMMKETIRKTADMHIVQIELKELLSQDPMDLKAVLIKYLDQLILPVRHHFEESAEAKKLLEQVRSFQVTK